MEAPSKRKKSGGRKKGTPNKVNSEIKSKINSVIEKELDKIDTLLLDLEPNDRANFLLKLMQYSIPKLTTSHVSVEEVEKPKFKGFEFLPSIKN